MGRTILLCQWQLLETVLLETTKESFAFTGVVLPRVYIAPDAVIRLMYRKEVGYSFTFLIQEISRAIRTTGSNKPKISID